MKRSKMIVLWICLGIFFSIFTISEYWLASFGESFLFFSPQLPNGITLKYDKYLGYKFLEEGFIHIVDEHKKIGTDTIVSIVAYKGSSDSLLIKAQTTNGEYLYLNIQILNSSDETLRYQIDEYLSEGTESWINLIDRRKIDIVQALRTISFLISIALLSVTSIQVYRVAFQRLK